MSSRKSEEGHEVRVRQLLQRAGLVCVRSPPTPEVHSSSSESLEYEPTEEWKQIEESIHESVESEESVEQEEVKTDIFPSPSLRRILPEHIRQIEEFNRVHVLPEKFNLDFDPLDIPIIQQTPMQVVIDVLGSLTGCRAYRSSLAEYWFLDTLANLLRRAQDALMDKPSQAILISWFCEWMKEVQHFDAADRRRMITRLEDNIKAAARFVVQNNRLPTPKDAGVFYQEEDKPPLEREGGKGVKAGTDYQCALVDLTNIAHYIYDLMATDFQYSLIRSVFTFTPDYLPTDAPQQIRYPKSLYVPRPKKPQTPKKEKQPAKKKKEVETEEYLELLQLQAREERELQEIESREQEEWLRRSCILPLRYAAGEDLYHSLWGVQPEPEMPMASKENKAKK